MIKIQRTGQIAPGKGMEAVTWAKEMAERSHQVTDITWEVYTQLGGPVGTIHWFGVYDNLAAVEEAAALLNANDEIGEIWGKVSELFIEGSLADSILILV